MVWAALLAEGMEKKAQVCTVVQMSEWVIMAGGEGRRAVQDDRKVCPWVKECGGILDRGRLLRTETTWHGPLMLISQCWS